MRNYRLEQGIAPIVERQIAYRKIRFTPEHRHRSFPSQNRLFGRVISALAHFLILKLDRAAKNLINFHTAFPQREVDTQVHQPRFSREEGPFETTMILKDA